MTFVNLDPGGTSSNTGAVTGSSAHAALSDTSDATFVEFSYGEGAVFTLSDLTLPADALLVLAQVFVRCGRDGTGPGTFSTLLSADVVKSITGSITWESPATLPGATVFGGLTDSGLDAATLWVSCTSLSAVTAYKAWVRVLYYLQPTVAVSAPTGTVATNIVKVEWTPSFDVHADPVGSVYEVKVFSSAQYGAGGFDPETSTATLSFEGSDGLSYHQFSQVLADGDYRAYVKVAAGNTPDHWSDWDYEAFTVDAPKPGNPSVSATGDNANGRVGVELDDSSGDVATEFFHVQRSDDGVTFTDLLTSLGDGLVAFSGSAVTVYDYEASNGVTTTYRARAMNDSPVSFSAWVSDTGSWSSSDEWQKCLLDPSKSLKLTVKSYPAFDVAANQGVFRPLGSSEAVVTQDVPGPEQGQVVLFSESESERDDLSDLLAAGSPVLMQVPGQPDRIVMFGDRSSTRVVDTAGETWHEESLGWTVVARPDGPTA